MSTDVTFIKQTKAKIQEWNHELLELEARVRLGVDDPSQSRICAQRIIELKSKINTAEEQMKEFSTS